jgi:tRNA/tmRNA/rRNA uracil-C5-methylase (TrmA/RlmC/RlmD family)
VLDAGCGAAELSLALAARGYTVVGIDVAPSAVAAATKAAEDRGLDNATFVCADITAFTGYDNRFSTIRREGPDEDAGLSADRAQVELIAADTYSRPELADGA